MNKSGLQSKTVVFDLEKRFGPKSKDQKRKEAKIRTEKYRNMDIVDRIIMAEKRPGNSKREIDKLMSCIQ